MSKSSRYIYQPSDRIVCGGVCGEIKFPSEFGRVKDVCKKCKKEIARRGLVQCTEGWGEFKPMSEFAEPGLCKECKNVFENSFDYYCNKDHCRELNIKELTMWLHSLSNEIYHHTLESDGSSGNDAEITSLIRHLMTFILYRMHSK